MEKYENGGGSKSRGRVVVLVPCPLEGHLHPMLQFGTLLYSKGFSITIAHTDFNSPDTSNYPNFHFVKLQDGLAGCDTSFNSLLTVIPLMNRNCKEPLLKFLTAAEAGDGGSVGCVIYDPVMYYTDAVATELKIPGLIFRANSAAYLQASMITLMFFAQQDGALLPESKLQDLVPSHKHLRFKDLTIPLHFRLPELVIELEADMSNIRSSSAIILNSTIDLESSIIPQLENDLKIPLFPLGPLHNMISNSTNQTYTEEDNICIEWLNQQDPNSVVYVSFGSVALLDEKDVVEIAWGLANSQQPFLWVVRRGSILGSKWTENLPQDFLELCNNNNEKGLIVKWAPQKEVLAHPAIGVFLSHCGWNSTLESVCEGVPMICRPCFADQNVNARYLAHVWKSGLELERPLQRETVVKAIHRVVVGDEGKEMKLNMLKLKKKLKASVKEDGNSSKSLDKLVKFIHALPK